ncbi:MAG: glycosyltransferase family 2 protein [Bacteroidota bacterium]
MVPGVTIVILNWNGRKFLEQFLPSVLATAYANFQVLVVDNGSTDDSIAYLQAEFPLVRLLELDRNYGFTTGNNKALPHVDTPYFVLLNNDVEVDPGWLGPMVEVMEADETVAAVQPKLLAYQDRDHFEYAGAAGGYLDVYGYPFSRGRLFECNEKDTGQYDAVQEIFWATGACMLIRKSVTDRIGLFEDRYFAHMEEIDFCWRAKNFGYKVMYTPHGKAWHLGGGTLPKSSPRKTYLNAHNSLATLLKNFPGRQVGYKLFLRLLLDGVWAIRALFQGDFATIGAIFKAHWKLFLSFGYWLKARRETYQEIERIPAQQSGYYRKSIVWQHFVRGIKSFTELPGIK